MDTSIRKIVITEDEDLDLDKLLLGDNSGVVANPIPSRPHSSPGSAPSSLLHAVQSTSSKTTVIKDKDTPTTPIVVLEEEEEDDEGLGHWILPEPGAREAISNLKRVPSKSILKKTSSYGNFDLVSSQSSNMTNSKKGGLGNRKGSRLSFTNLLDVSSTSMGSSTGKINNNRSQVHNDNQQASPLDSSLSGGVKRRTKQASFLSMASSNSNHSTGSGSRSNALGWDLDDSSSGIHHHASSPTSSPRVGKFLLNGLPPPSVPSLSSSSKPQQVLTSTSDGGVVSADQAAGICDRSSRHSSQASLGDSNSVPRIRRNVSFHSVDVREYDRTVGDNPSCRSGPPLSLDWSYSKKYEKNIEEYELQRSTERATKLSQIHVNKYKRRNLLAFHWGHSEDELKEARGSTKKIQRQRSMTQMMLPIHLAEEAVISFKKFINKKKGKEEDEIYSDMSNSGSTKDITNSHRGAEDLEIPSSQTA